MMENTNWGQLFLSPKFIISIILDVIDFFLPPGFETAYDLVLTGVAFLMFGPKGLTALWEVVEFSSAVDRFIPTLTIIAIMDFKSNWHNSGRNKELGLDSEEELGMLNRGYDKKTAERFKRRFGIDPKYRNIVKNIKPVTWLLLIVVLVLAVMYFLVTPTFFNALLSPVVTGAFVVGIVIGLLKGKNLKSGIIYGLVFAFIAAAVLFFLPAISEAAIPVVSNIPILNQVGPKALDLIKSPEKIVENILPRSFSTPETVEPPQRTLSAKFLNPIARTPTNVVVQVGVLSKEDITVVPKCYLDGRQIGTDVSELTFEGSSSEQFVYVTCDDSQNGSKLSLKLEADFTSEALLEVFVGEGEDKGNPSSKMIYGSPYSLSLDLLGDQPIRERQLEYPLEVKFFRDEKNTKVVKLKSLELSTKTDKFGIRCDQPFSDLEYSGDREKIDEIVVNKDKDAILFTCNIDVLDMPEEGIEKSWIESKATYTIEKEFKTTLRKS
ncbi:hypothetical protein ACFLZZ_02205 [Nanoarchaeota archaeon]